MNAVKSIFEIDLVIKNEHGHYYSGFEQFSCLEVDKRYYHSSLAFEVAYRHNGNVFIVMPFGNEKAITKSSFDRCCDKIRGHR